MATLSNAEKEGLRSQWHKQRGQRGEYIRKLAYSPGMKGSAENGLDI